MLSEGKGGFIDYSKYRQQLTDIIWGGKVPELTPEQQVEAAQEAVGEPTPQSALEEARALYEASKQRQAELTN